MEGEGAKDSMIAEMRVALDDAVRGRREAEELLARCSVFRIEFIVTQAMEKLHIM